MVVMSLVASPRIRIVVDTGVSSQFVRPRELLAATGILAMMRFFSSVSSDVPGLMLQAVKGLVTEWAFVRSGELLGAVYRLNARNGTVGFEDRDSCGSHLGSFC